MATTAKKPTPTNQDFDDDAELLPAAAAIAERIPREAVLMRMENETMQSMAIRHPRDYGQVLADIKTQLRMYPSFAKAAIYQKPVGKDRDTNEEKFARGLSIRAAEAVAEAYGYNRLRTSVELVPEDRDCVRVLATFTDFQRGRVIEDESIICKRYTDSKKRPQRYNDDRFFGVVVKAEKARLRRDVILHAVPSGLKLELFEAAEAAMAENITDADVLKIISAFGIKLVLLQEIERYLEAPYTEWTKEHRVALAGLWTAVKDGETTIEDVFGPRPEAPVAPSSGAGPVSGADLVQGQQAAAATPVAETSAPASPESASPASAAPSQNNPPEAAAAPMPQDAPQQAVATPTPAPAQAPAAAKPEEPIDPRYEADQDLLVPARARILKAGATGLAQLRADLLGPHSPLALAESKQTAERWILERQKVLDAACEGEAVESKAAQAQPQEPHKHKPGEQKRLGDD